MATQYKAVNKGLIDSRDWTPFLKQLHISSGVWTLYFMNGLSSGAPTVFIPQIRKEWNATAIVDDEFASWIYSASNFATLPWVFVLPVLTHLIGRKIPYLASCVAMSAVFTLLYFSSSPYLILIAEVIQGFGNAIGATVIIHVIPEYCNQKYRGIYLNIQCTSFYWGMWVSNAIGTYLNWKYIAVLGLVCALYSLTIGFHPESPRWLANKGKITECKEALRWLRGSDAEAEEELRDLIIPHADYSGDDHKMTCSNLVTTLKCKLFYMPLLLVILVGAQYNFSGKLVCSIYAIDIFKKVTEDEDAAYTGMLILDGITVIGMYAGSFLSKVFRLRSLYFSLSFVSVCAMFAFSLYLYLVQLGFIQESNVVVFGFLVLYSLAVSTGPIVLGLNFYSELISIRYQAISYVLVGFVFIISSTVMLKISPVLFAEFGIHGCFLFYGLACSIITLLLYTYLPETENKTLEEIEEHFKDAKCIPEAEILTKAVVHEVR